MIFFRSRSMSPPTPYQRPAPPRKAPPASSGHKVMSPPPKRIRARPPSPASPPPQTRRMPPMTPPPARKAAAPTKQQANASDRPTDPRRQPPPPRPRGSTGEVIDVRGVKPPPKQIQQMNKKPIEKVGVQPVSNYNRYLFSLPKMIFSSGIFFSLTFH